MTNISFVPSICIHRSIILIFIEKSMLVDFFHGKNIFLRFSIFISERILVSATNSRLCCCDTILNMICSIGLHPRIQYQLHFFGSKGERKGCNNSWTFPRATETFGSITSHFVSLNSDVENTVLYTVLGVREAQINTVIDTVWGSKVVNAQKKNKTKKTQTNKKQSPKVFFIQNLKINT